MEKNKILLVVVGLAVGGYLIGSSASTEDKTKRDEKGQIQQSGDLGAFKLKVGDCFNDLPSITGTDMQHVEKVTGVPCSGSHHWEVYAEKDSSLTTYDGNAIEQESIDFCGNENAIAFVKNFSVERQNQIAELYGDDLTILNYIFPDSQESFNYSKTINCIIGSYTKYYTGSIRE